MHVSRIMMNNLPFAFLACLMSAYFLGSIPFGLILTRVAGMGDIRKIGSGNIGATNVLRTGNKKLAALTLLLDGLKGYFAIWIASFVGMFFALSNEVYFLLVMSAAFITLLGHLYPVWLGFKGGKGVATYIGILFGLMPILGAFACMTWLLSAYSFRFSSLAALIMAATIPFISLAWTNTLFIPTILMSLLVIYRHKANIQRLFNHTETKIGQRS